MSGPERRKDQRVTMPFAITFRFEGDPMVVQRSATVRDFSAGGVRLATDQLLEPGSTLELHIILPVRREPYILKGQVVWAKESGHELSEYGVMFVEVNPGLQFELNDLVEFLKKNGGQKTL